MDEFKSKDELKPDSGDRCSPRPRKGPTIPKVPVSRQYLMIGIGILVLLFLVISVGSALKSPSHTDSSRQVANDNGQRNVDLFGLTYGSDAASSSHGATAQSQSANNSQTNSASLPQELRGPQIASTLTEATPITTPSGQQGKQINGVSTRMNGQGPVSTLPNVAATLTPSSCSGTKPHKSVSTANALAADRQAASAPKATSRVRTPSASVSIVAGSAAGTIQSAPAGYYTLQLSSASQPTTLNAYAHQQQLSHYWVYQTRRDGKPWYVLVNGVYPSLSQAKNAMAQFPADVQANKPWARQIGQVKMDQNN